MAVSEFVIPKQYYPGLKALQTLDNNTYAQVRTSLESIEHPSSLSNIAASVASKTGQNLERVDELVRMLASLYTVRATVEDSLEQFVDSIIQALQRTDQEELKPPHNDIEAYKRKLIELLSLDRSFGATVKANSLTYQNERLFQGAEIATDIRPIFGTNPAEPPVAALLAHNLRFSYFEDGELREFFITLDRDDVKRLHSVLERAEAKAKSLTDLLKDTALPIWGESNE